MTGQTISHYRILEELGEGGMGVVYKAEDTELRRVVALKFLHSSQDRAQLLREAQVAAALHHPNICTVFEVDEERGFLAMEYVEGQTLKALLAGRPLPAGQAIAIAVQIGEGLKAAHQKRIVHRDIKPANVMVAREGQAKIMDFGLARVAGQTGLTKEGLVSGTPGYMAPEQLSGGTVDQRADLWALGVVLHEMLTGRAPAVGRVDPLPTGLDRLVRKALAAEPEQRYQQAADLIVDLRMAGGEVARPSRRGWIAAAGVAGLAGSILGWRVLFGVRGEPRIESLAVLPLRNLAGDAAQDYFADGTTEALITSLAQIRSVKVISRSSVMRFKGSDKPLAEIARELGVDGIIEGSVQRVGGRVRVSAQLIHAATDANLWAREYDRDLSDVLLLQSEIARAVADEIRASVSEGERSRLAKAQSRNPEAQEAFLLGNYHVWKMNERDLATAIGHFERAVALDPRFAAAYALLSFAWQQRGVYGNADFHAVGVKAKRYAEKALEIDPLLAEAHAVLGKYMYHYEWDWTGAETELKKSNELAPHEAQTYMHFAFLFMSLGRLDESVESARRFVALDPLNSTAYSALGRALYRARRNEEAIPAFHRAIELDSLNYGAYGRLADVYEAMGDYKKAMELLDQVDQMAPSRPKYSTAHARLLALMGRTGEARKMLAQLTSRLIPGKGANQSGGIALAYFALGELDKGFLWLEKAFDQKDLVIFTKFDPKFDSVRSDPRFQKIVAQLGIPDQ